MEKHRYLLRNEDEDRIIGFLLLTETEAGWINRTIDLLNDNGCLRDCIELINLEDNAIYEQMR